MDQSSKSLPAGWIARYWQWIYSLPLACGPLKTGLTSLQSWELDEFLCFPCTGGGEDYARSVTINGDCVDKDILIPVFAAAYIPEELEKSAKVENLLAQAREDVANPVSIEISVDSIALQPVYLESLEFPVRVSADYLRGNSCSYFTIGSSAGYWFRLDPFSGGTHTIRFGGQGKNGFFTRVQYTVEVPK